MSKYIGPILIGFVAAFVVSWIAEGGGVASGGRMGPTCVIRSHARLALSAENSVPMNLRPSARAITPAELDAYAASKEWVGKAGGYAIQETADRFVVALEEGGFDNVVGLPVALALELLARTGAPCGSTGR